MIDDKKEKQRQYWKKYCYQNREMVTKKSRDNYANRTEEQKEIDRIKRKKYYEENKQKVKECQVRYRENNREKFNQIMMSYRKRKALEFKEQGQMYCYFSRTERERKMVEKLAHKKHISLELSRELLMKNDWNIKKLLSEEVVYNA